MKQTQFDGWISVFESGIDYEAEMARDRLVDDGLSAVIMAKKDRAFGLMVGALSRIYVLVPPNEAEAAIHLLRDNAFTAAELTEAALASNPDNVEAPTHEGGKK